MSIVCRREVPSEEIARVEALYAIAGEEVRFRSGANFVDVDARELDRWRETFSDLAVGVRETIVDEQGCIRYSFVDIEGEFPASAFEPAIPMEHHYGVLLTREGRTWILPLDANSPEGVVRSIGEPRLIARELGRAGRYFVGDGDIDRIFEKWDASPSVGEFVLTPIGDSGHRIEGVPWWSACFAEEIAAAEGALASLVNASVGSAWTFQ